jgi:hypothetical protein
MRKITVFVICVLCGLVGLFYVPAIHAGPLIEFGENGGYFQMDLKAVLYRKHGFWFQPNEHQADRYALPSG